MATIHKGHNELRAKANKFLLVSILFWIVPITYMIDFMQGFTLKGYFIFSLIGWGGVFYWRKYSLLHMTLSFLFFPIFSIVIMNYIYNILYQFAITKGRYLNGIKKDYKYDSSFSI